MDPLPGCPDPLHLHLRDTAPRLLWRLLRRPRQHHYERRSQAEQHHALQLSGIYQNHGPNSNRYQYQPTIDLGADYAVTSLELSYVAHPAPNKYAPEKVVVSCRSALSASAAAPVRVELTFSGLSNYGGHTVRVDLAQCGRVRYITLERIEPIQGGTNIGELAVLGCQSSMRYCAST